MISPLVRSQKYWLNNLGSGWLNMIDPFSLVLAWQKAWCSVESIHRGALRTSWYLLRHMPIQLHWLYMNSWKHICTYCYIHQPLDSLDVHKTYTSIHHLYIIYTSSIHHLYISIQYGWMKMTSLQRPKKGCPTSPGAGWGRTAAHAQTDACRTVWFNHTVDGRNPAPVDSVDSWFIPLFMGFRPSKVVQDFATIHSMLEIYGKKHLSCFVMFWQLKI